MIFKLKRLIRTIIYLRPIQIGHQVLYRAFKIKSLGPFLPDLPPAHQSLVFSFSAEAPTVFRLPSTFTFLNVQTTFKGQIDWNFSGYGKLWTYNLQYCVFLLQKNLSDDVRGQLVKDLYTSLANGEVHPEPYPSSLRIMNMIRFLSSRLPGNGSKDLKRFLYADLQYLNKRYEYHLLGNHLLENGFAMMMGGYFFNRRSWLTRARSVLERQLKEQILQDGAHFERSVMYHQIILFRVLEGVDYLPADEPFLPELKRYASLMLGWLKSMTFRNGHIPHFNDSTDGIALLSEQLFDIARGLGIDTADNPLDDSGYRKLSTDRWEMIADVAGVEPSYQPGHAHSHHLSFVLHLDNKPFLIDPGISTYNISPRRDWERSSIAHNTVTINGENQSEVWGGFRVGRRARLVRRESTRDTIDGCIAYNVRGGNVVHARSFINESGSLIIKDKLSIEEVAVARFYLHPDVKIESLLPNQIKFVSGAAMSFTNHRFYDTESYTFAEGFNKLREGVVIKVSFSGLLYSRISVNV